MPNCATDYLSTIIITTAFSFNSLYLIISNSFEENDVLTFFPPQRPKFITLGGGNDPI